MTYTDTPIEYSNRAMYGRIDVAVEDGESNADFAFTDASGTVNLRLSRAELAALIASAATAMAALD